MELAKLLGEVEKHVLNLIQEKSPTTNLYHDLTHTSEVVKVAKTIGQKEGFKENDLMLLQIAAWFHDIGYIDGCENHEVKSSEYARKFLSEKKLEEEKINKITSAIMATKMPPSPKDLFEEVLCDADLAHVGRKDFFDKSAILRMEVERRDKIEFTDSEWYKKNIDFIAKHRFFTNYATDKYQEQKNSNILKLQKKLKKKEKKNKESNLKTEKFEFEKEKLETKKEFDKRAERGIETMFRNVMRTHVSFSAMADNKANIMISVNTLLITAIVAILLRKLDSNPHLIVPTAVLTTVSLVTLIFAVLVTRPKVTSGTFTKEDIDNKIVNLLYFGNFSNMSLDDFSWGMKELMNDRDYLYSSMIKDFYFLGNVLGQKYKYLRICYNIFMYGLILSVIAYTIAIILYPEGTQLDNLLE
ncbi:MAG: DUF5706 domain-containing protein [Ignavibacteria bacterium]|jgi:predicted metal-dependent HD superfamily phosphohydrolase